MRVESGTQIPMPEDLSNYHRPVTDLFHAPETAEGWEACGLTDEQVASYSEQGYVAASFHHPRMIHGSYANDTDSPRRATVINVFRDGVRSNSDAPPLEGVPVIPKGQPMGGRFFPLLFESQNRERKPRG